MTGSIRLARKTPVAACQGLLAIEPLLVQADMDLLDAMRRSAVQPSTRLIGILDRDGRLAGVLPVSRLADTVVAHAVPESFLGDLSGIAGVAEFGHAVEAKVVGDVMLPPAAISAQATIGDAFREMHHRSLSGLYVVDGDGRPTGYLDLQELAMRYVDALEDAAHAGTGPRDAGGGNVAHGPHDRAGGPESPASA